MIKLQATQSPIIRSQVKAAESMPSSFKDHYGHGTNSETAGSNKISHDVVKRDQFKLNNNFNTYDMKTAKNINFSGLSISKGSELLEKLNKTSAHKAANNLKAFWKKAKENQTVFDAMFALLITCGLRPAAILAQSNEQNKQKNEKAASHSISSGIIGYGLAVAIFNPIKDGLDKMSKDPEKYLRKLEKWMSYGGKKLLQNSQRLETYKVIVNQGSQAVVAPFRSLITIAMIPLIDRLVLNKIFKTDIEPSTRKELQNDPTYKFGYINFKNNQESKKVFQNFAGVMK